MKKVLCGLLLLRTGLSATPLPAAKPGTTFYVVALTGAEVHAQPSFTAHLVRRLPLGSGVQAQQTIASLQRQQIGTGLALPGNWVKVTTPTYSGYVFSADLTLRKPAVRKSSSGMPYIDLLGPKKRSYQPKPPVASRPRNRAGEQTTTEVTEYANGTYTRTAADGCFTHAYVFRQLALNEVYHQLMSSYAGYEGKQLQLPKLVSIKGNVYTFTCGFGDTDAEQHLQLTIQPNGTYTISSYDCT